MRSQVVLNLAVEVGPSSCRHLGAPLDPDADSCGPRSATHHMSVNSAQLHAAVASSSEWVNEAYHIAELENYGNLCSEDQHLVEGIFLRQPHRLCVVCRDADAQ